MWYARHGGLQEGDHTLLAVMAAIYGSFLALLLLAQHHESKKHRLLLRMIARSRFYAAAIEWVRDGEKAGPAGKAGASTVSGGQKQSRAGIWQGTMRVAELERQNPRRRAIEAEQERLEACRSRMESDLSASFRAWRVLWLGSGLSDSLDTSLNAVRGDNVSSSIEQVRQRLVTVRLLVEPSRGGGGGRRPGCQRVASERDRPSDSRRSLELKAVLAAACGVAAGEGRGGGHIHQHPCDALLRRLAVRTK